MGWPGRPRPQTLGPTSEPSQPWGRPPRDLDEITAGTGCLSSANTLSLGSQPEIQGRAGMGLWAVGLPVTLCGAGCVFLYM